MDSKFRSAWDSLSKECMPDDVINFGTFFDELRNITNSWSFNGVTWTEFTECARKMFSQNEKLYFELTSLWKKSYVFFRTTPDMFLYRLWQQYVVYDFKFDK